MQIRQIFEPLIQDLYLMFLQREWFLRWGEGMFIFIWKLDWKLSFVYIIFS